jgi:hypothetical protein
VAAAEVETPLLGVVARRLELLQRALRLRGDARARRRAAPSVKVWRMRCACAARRRSAAAFSRCRRCCSSASWRSADSPASAARSDSAVSA